MRAAVVERLDGPSGIVVRDVAEPEPAADELIVRVRASGVAYPALLQSRGQYQVRPDPPFVPGSEVAGEVVHAPAASRFAVGDRVGGFCRRGGFAELAAVRACHAFALPDTVSFETGAALVTNYPTAHFALRIRAGLAEGESVLVLGAAGGVGSAAIQVARAFGAASVTGIVSTAHKGEAAIAAGAERYLLADAPLEDEDRGSVDVVFDPVGGAGFADALRRLAPGGRHLVIGFVGGGIPEVKVNRLLLSNTSVVGAAWGSWVLADDERMPRQWRELEPFVRSGLLAPRIHRAYPLAEAADALAALEDRHVIGKIVLTAD